MEEKHSFCKCTSLINRFRELFFSVLICCNFKYYGCFFPVIILSLSMPFSFVILTGFSSLLPLLRFTGWAVWVDGKEHKLGLNSTSSGLLFMSDLQALVPAVTLESCENLRWSMQDTQHSVSLFRMRFIADYVVQTTFLQPAIMELLSGNNYFEAGLGSTT